MATTLIGVPPGVGDLYWALTKLRAFRKHFGFEHVTLAIQKTSKDRAIEWQQMVDFVDDARYVAFTPGPALRTGFERNHGPLDFILWPNAVLDRGEHLSTWMPDLALDLEFQVETRLPPAAVDEIARGAIVLYASAVGVNRAWFPKRRGDFWIALARELEQRFGRKPILIGAGWDRDNNIEALREHTFELVGSTTLSQVAFLLQNARGVIGVISGMTILANHFKTPTVAFAPDKHHPEFPYTWIRPGAQPWYTALRPISMWDPAACAAALEGSIRIKETATCNSSASSSGSSAARSS